MTRTAPLLRAATAGAAVLISTAFVVGCAGRPALQSDLADAQASAQSYPYTGAVQTITVPAGVTAAVVVIAGASGGAQEAFGNTGGSSADGGRGASVSGTVSVTPGDVLTLCVGGVGGVNDSNKTFGKGGWSCAPAASATQCPGAFVGGDGGSSKGATRFDGPGGGGASAILSGSGEPLVVAAGGGGAGRQGDGGNGGGATGGNGLVTETNQTPAQGGSSTSSWSAKGQSPHKTTWNALGLGDGGGGGGGGCHNGQGGLVDSDDAMTSGGSGAGGNSLTSALTDPVIAKAASGNGSITITFIPQSS